MRIAVMGAGGLGGGIGGLLARAGEDVTFVARGAHLQAIRQRGLTVKSDLVGAFTLPAWATDDPAAIGPVDLVLVGVKTYDLDDAAEQIRPLIGPDTMILPIQNGVDAAERLGLVGGPEHVLGGVAYVGGHVEAPGIVVHTLLTNRLIIGELDGGTSARAERLKRVIERAGIGVDLRPDIRIAIWEKFVMLAGSGGLMALTRLSAGPVRECPETRALFRGALEEAAAVARARRVPLAGDCVDSHMALIDGLPRSARGSMTADLLAGRRLELEALNGTVVRLGRSLGVLTPINCVVYAGLKPYANGAPVT